MLVRVGDTDTRRNRTRRKPAAFIDGLLHFFEEEAVCVCVDFYGVTFCEFAG